MHQAGAAIDQPLQIIIASGVDAMGQQAARGQEVQILQPSQRRKTAQLFNHRHLAEPLAAVQTHRRVEFAAQCRSTLQQRRRTRLDAIRQQRAANQAAMSAVEIPEKPLGRLEPGHAPGFVPVMGQRAVCLPVAHAAHVAGAKVSAQPQLGRHPGHRGKLVVGLGPLAVVHRGDRHGRGDAVADQLGEGVAVFEDFFFGAVAFPWTARQILRRPHPAHVALVAVVQGQHRGIEIAQGIQIDEAGTDQRITVINPLIHRPRITTPDKLDARAFEHHFAIAPQHMPRAVEADHATGPQADALHRRLSSKRPPAAIN
ncbi:hypothetical protein D3C76_754800 [compost metagenome]